MSISDRLNKLTTDITNAYTSIENKGGTIPANKNTENMSTAINSIEVIETATAEGESLSLTNTKAMPYSDYVVKGKSGQEGEPSPSNPSEIHSVADDVNLFDASKINNPTAITVSNNGETITMPIASSGNGAASTNATLKQLCPDLQVGDYIYLNFTRNLGKTYNNLIYLAGSGKEIYNASAYSFNTGTTITQQDLDSTVYLYGNRYSSGETQQCIITDFKIQKNKITPYSPYNQGTVTIKQRGTTESDDFIFQTEPLRSLPNGVKDTIEADGIHRRVGRVVLDGSNDENWRLWSASLTNVERFYINIEGADIVNSLCDKFKYLPGNEDEEHYRDSTSGGMNKQFVIFINKSRLSEVSINGLKQYLQDNPIKLLYKLAEETIEPLTQNQATTMLDIIKTGSYEGTTNIYTDEDVKPTIGVDYYKNGETGGLPTVVEGVPPLTFPSNGNNLLNYRIDGTNGGVGDRTANLLDYNWLFDYEQNRVNDYFNYIQITLEPNTTYNVTSDYDYNQAQNATAFIVVNSNTAITTANGGLFGSLTVTTTQDGILKIARRIKGNNETMVPKREDFENNSKHIQISINSVNDDNYEPYGKYKIPVVCGGTTTNIYIDEPIGANESKSLSDTNVNIPTINGTNILSIDTTIQPSNVYVQAPKTNNYNL